MLKVMIIDDFKISVMGINALLTQIENIEKAITFTNPSDGLQYALNNEVDLILCDIEMPGMKGFDFLKRIKVEKPRIKVIMLTISENKEDILKAIALDANGYIFKDIDVDELKTSIDMAMNGDFACNAKLLNILIDDIQEIARARSTSTKEPVSRRRAVKTIDTYDNISIAENLTEREFEILKLIGKGFSTKEISEHFGISPYTVSTYRKNLYAKLGIEHLSNLIKVARRTVESVN